MQMQPQFAMMETLMGKMIPLNKIVKEIYHELGILRAKWTTAVWRKQFSTLNNLKKDCERLAYKAGISADDMFRILCCFDCIEGDDLRPARKQNVLLVKGEMEQADHARLALMRLAKLVTQRMSLPPASLATETDAAQHAVTSAATEADDSTTQHGGMDTEQFNSEPANPVHTRDERNVEPPAMPAERVPRWKPRSQQRMLPDGVQLCLYLHGVDSSTVKVDLRGCQLTVSGLRMFPEAWFKETYELSPDFDRSRVTMQHREDVLIISLPFACPPFGRPPTFHPSMRPCAYGVFDPPRFSNPFRRPVSKRLLTVAPRRVVSLAAASAF